MTWLFLLLLAAAAVGGGLVWRRRQDAQRADGLRSFRRHMDALSPEARRNVIERVRDAHPRDRE
jgi:hypothetical protein